jgi:YVTN family beta-propeller protein
VKLTLGLVIIGGAAVVLPAADLLLTVHKRADSLGIYDLATGQPVAAIQTGVKPHELALTADRRYALVTDYGVDTYTTAEQGGNTITIIDLRSRQVSARIDLGSYHRPHGIERGRSGAFYVSTEKPSALLLIDARRRQVKSAIPLPGALPHMIAVSADETRVWTADAGSGTVTAMDIRTKKQLAQVEVGGVPMGLALSRDEKRLYCSTRTGNTVAVIDAVTNRLRRQIGVPGQPARLLLSPDGATLYASLYESGEVAAIDTRLELESRRAKAGAAAEGMALHPDGESLFVSAQGENRIVQLALPGLGLVRTIQTAARPDPIHILTGQ